MGEEPRAGIRPAGFPPPDVLGGFIEDFNSAVRETVDHPAHYGGAENRREPVDEAFLRAMHQDFHRG